eukprot:g18868.t1
MEAETKNCMMRLMSFVYHHLLMAQGSGESVEDASSSSSSQGPPPVHSEEKPLQKLVDMGFSRRKSLAALQSHGGSAEDAIAELLSSPQD